MRILKNVLTIIINILFGVFAGTALLCIALSLPNGNVDKHVGMSAETIMHEGTYPDISRRFSSTLDNFNDSMMLIEAADNSDNSLLQRSMAIYRGNIDGCFNPAESLVYHYIDDTPYDRTYTYPRYWHGYLVFLKPLLEIVTYDTLRIINGIIQFGFFLLTAYFLVKRKKELYVIPWMLGYLMLMPIVQAKSLQYSSCYYIFMLGVATLLLLSEEQVRKYEPFVFLNIGILLAYFDLSILSY